MSIAVIRHYDCCNVYVFQELEGTILYNGLMSKRDVSSFIQLLESSGWQKAKVFSTTTMSVYNLMVERMNRKVGMLALMSGRPLDLKVCCSAAGFYIGTTDENGAPYTRESEEYYRTRNEAQDALMHNTFTQRLYP